jgi:hypothetical protein
MKSKIAAIGLVLVLAGCPAPTEPAPAPVHPGAFCSPEGATGQTESGTAMVCRRESGEERPRWRGVTP